MSISSKDVETFGSPRVQAVADEWHKSNTLKSYYLFKEIELEKDRPNNHCYIKKYPLLGSTDIAAYGIATLVTAEFIDRSEGEAFLSYWRDGGEQALLPANEYVMKGGLKPKTDRRDCQVVIAQATLSEVEAWRLL